MKKTFTLIVVLCSLFMSSMAQVLYDETFDYPYANLALEPSWTTAGTLTTGTGRNIVTPALTYSNGGGTYFHSGLGKTINTDISSSNGYSSLKPFTATPVGGTSTVYLTVMYKAGVTQSQSNSEVFGMATGTSAGAKVYVGKGAVTTTSFRFGTTRGSSTGADIKWGTTEFADVNAIILVVLKYDFATQTSSVFLNPTISGTEPASPETFDNISGTIRTSLNNLWFRATGTSISKYNVSGARVSTTWAAAVAVQVPQLSPPVVGTASSISNTGFTANWTSVANATGYTVKVYSGATLVNTTNASGQATGGIAITGLVSATTYTYTVTAVADGINYTSSSPSAASESFTILGLVPPVVGVATSITAGGFTANWTAVANATGYDVKVYLGTLLVSTTNAPGQATSSLAITGLSFGTSYTFVVIAKGDGETYLDSSPSAASPVFITSYVTVNTIHTDFGDGTWGTPVPSVPANGSFPSSSINGFIFEKSVIRANTKRDRRGDTHINDITFDNVTYGGLVVFPVVNSVEQIELHAYTGTAERTFFLEEYNTITSTWDSIGTRLKYNTASKASGLDSIYVIPISRSAPTKFRVRNNGAGSFNVAQVITRLTNPATLIAPVTGVATDITRIGFNANWTAAANATGYDVFVYKRDVFVSKTNVGGQGTSSLAITGLMPDSTYTFKVQAEGDGDINYSDSYLSLASVALTTLSAVAPSIDTPTATAVLNSSATLGGTITSDGDNTVTERGTVWNTTTGVAITDNKLAEGLTATGIFTQSRTGLHAKSKIFYAAYATNLKGTSLTAEGSFYTLADEPLNQVTDFTATAGTTSVDLSWTAAAGADGYFILQRQSASAPTGVPADATVYTAGSVLGDGTVAAYVASGTTTEITISALSSNSAYSFSIMSVNSDGDNAATYNYFTTLSPTASATTLVPAAVAYTWNKSGTASWATAGNWTPTRTTPQINDILQFNGGGSVVATNVPGQTIGQLLVSNNTNVELQSAGSVVLTINGESGVDFNVASGSTLVLTGIDLALASGLTGTVGGNVTTNALNVTSATFTVASGASLITNGAVSGDVTVERNFVSGADTWHLFCLPTSNGYNASPLFDGAYVDTYSENAGAWNRLVTADFINPKTGYAVNFQSGSHTLAFTGAINTGDQSFSGLSYTAGAPGYGAGWHIAGNPFPSAVAMDAVADLSPVNLDGYVYVWDGVQYVASNGSLSTLPGNVIPAMQGFFVKSNASSAGFVVPQAARVHSNTFYKKAEFIANALYLNINGNGYEDNAIVAFNPLSTEGFDGKYDAYKLYGKTEAPQLYSILSTERAAINSLPSSMENSNVALGLKVGTANTYTLNVKGFDSFDATVPVLLEDMKTGVVQDLKMNSTYSFTAEPGDAENRFKLWFVETTSINDRNAAGINARSANGIIRITHDAFVKGTVYVYSASGQLVATSNLNAGETTLRTNSAGVYVVKVVTSKTTVTQKVVVTK